MTDHHLITPPPELVQQWFLDAKAMPVDQWVTDVATCAARWGADQELEACCEWLRESLATPSLVQCFLAARRPKPPSLKELALANTNAILNDPNRALLTEVRETLELNRRALEQLDD